MAIPTQKVVTEWALDPSQFNEEIGKAFKKMRQAEMATKRLDAIQARLNGTYDSAGNKIKKTSSAVTEYTTRTKALIEQTKKLNIQTAALARKAKLAETGTSGLGVASTALKGAMLGLAVGGIALAVRGLKELVKETGKFTQASNIYTGDIRAATMATKGLVSQLDIMNSKNKLTALGVKLTDDQFVKLLSDTQKMATAMNRDMGPALDDIATALARQSVRVADNVGVILSATDANKKWADAHGVMVSSMTDSEKRLAFQVEFMTQLSEKAKLVPPRVKTMSDEFDVLSIALKTDIMRIAGWINKTVKLIAIADALFPKQARIRQMLREQNRESAAHLAASKKELGEMVDLLDLESQLLAGKPESGFVESKTRKSVNQSLVKSVGLFASMDNIGGKILSTDLRNAKSKKEQLALARSLAKLRGEKITKSVTKKAAKIELPGLPAASASDLSAKFAAITGDKAAANAEKVAMSVKSAMDAAKSLPVSNIPLVRMLDEQQFEAALKAKTLFDSIKAKMDAMVLSGDTATASYRKLAAQLTMVGAATIGAANKVTKFRQSIIDTSDDIGGMGKTAFSSFATALFNVADAAEASGESISTEILKALGSVLKALAIESGIKAIFSLAEYAMSGFGDASKLAAAGLYAAVAVAAGGASAGISAAAGSSSGSTAKTTSTASSKPTQFAQSVEDKRPVNINVFFNDPLDPSSAFVRKKSITTTISKSQTVGA